MYIVIVLAIMPPVTLLSFIKILEELSRNYLGFLTKILAKILTDLYLETLPPRFLSRFSRFPRFLDFFKILVRLQWRRLYG